MKKKDNTLVNEFVNLIKNSNKLSDYERKRGVYFINAEVEERTKLFKFFKAIGIQIQEVGRENHKNMGLIDVYFDRERPFVSYLLWHCLQSNIIRVRYSHSYTEFKELVQESELLSKYL